MNQSPDCQITIENARQTALNLVARREHSIAELRYKLKQRQVPSVLIEDVVSDFLKRNWLNDDRFCEVYVRKRYHDGCGEQRIRQELRLRGIENPGSQHFQQPEFDWFERCREVYLKKYRETASPDHKQVAKRQRFLQYRGFTFEQIAYAMQQSK